MSRKISALLFGGFVFFFSAVLLCPGTGIGQDSGSGHGTPVDVVLGLARPSGNDILILRNGEQLRGTIDNKEFTIRTFYGPVAISRHHIAGLGLTEGTNNIRTVITVNNNRFSGFLQDTDLAVTLQTGEKIRLRKEEVDKAVFGIRDGEGADFPPGTFISLINGDFFTGTLANDTLLVSAPTADTSLDVSEVESVNMVHGEVMTVVVQLRNGNKVEGNLQTEDLRITLDIGPEITLYKNDVALVYRKAGYVPETDNMNELVRLPANSPGPAEIILKTAQARKPAFFPHHRHQGRYTCGTCHHGEDASGSYERYTEETVIRPCTACHNPAMPNKELNDFQGIGHKLCRECHRANQDITSALCSTCHR